MRLKTWTSVVLLLFLGISCATLPEVKHKSYIFPKGQAFLKEPSKSKRPFEVIGYVRAKVNFKSLDAKNELETLCRNYYNKAVSRLVNYAKKKGGHAVVNVVSVVFYVDGTYEAFPGAECSDDGAEGQILVRGEAIRWLPRKKKQI